MNDSKFLNGRWSKSIEPQTADLWQWNHAEGVVFPCRAIWKGKRVVTRLGRPGTPQVYLLVFINMFPINKPQESPESSLLEPGCWRVTVGCRRCCILAAAAAAAWPLGRYRSEGSDRALSALKSLGLARSEKLRVREGGQDSPRSCKPK